jgi:hypothetical protein
VRSHTDSSIADWLNEYGRRLDDNGRRRLSRALYRCARIFDPTWAVPAYNIGLSYKQERRWRESGRWNELAAQDAGRGDPALWNLGIAATAMGNWPVARSAWTRFGIELPGGEGPPEMEEGCAFVRVNPVDAPEVVWATRIDPARAVIRSVPLPESQRRYGDLVLNDGAPNGHRLVEGRELPVFDELQLLSPSAYSTFELRIEGADPTAIENLIQLFRDARIFAENWTTSIHVLCKSCSEGKPHGPDHNHAAARTPADSDRSWRLGVAAQSAGEITKVTESWSTEGAEASFELACLVDAR